MFDVRAGLVLTVTLLLAACGDGPSRGVQVGSPAPAYGAVTLEGDSVHLADLRDRVVLLNVWATWCLPCREEIPALQEIHEQYGARGLEVVGVSIDSRNERDNLRGFADGFNVTYTLWHDPDDGVRNQFRIIGVPSTYLIDRQGVIVWFHMGPVTADDPGLMRALASSLESQSS